MDSLDPEPTYTVYIRLPFPRGDFEDPPQVEWGSSKDDALWSILSGAAKNEIDWEELAGRFDVTVDFILQQATYLTERHASKVRAQMRKAATSKGSSAASPVPDAELDRAVAEPMRRAGSGGGGRAPSSLSVRRESPLPRNDGSLPGTPVKSAFQRPPVSRNSSANTTVLSRRAAGASSPKLDQAPPIRSASPTRQRGRFTSLPVAGNAESESDTPSAGAQDSSSNLSDSSSSPAQSRIFLRPPRPKQQQDVESSLGDGDDEAEPAFLPLGAQQHGKDLSATLRGDPREMAKRRQQETAKDKETHQSQTSDSSPSSAAPAQTPNRSAFARRPPGPLSPRRTAELAGRSPAGKGKGYSREGSDGTPSMGSSFSDLDDASVTQSALEEALASGMKDVTVGSRISLISQALKSRYVAKPNPS